MDTVAIEGAPQNGAALAVTFEQNKVFEKCPFKVNVDSQKSCHLVLNIPLLNEVMRTMSVAMKGEKLDFHYFAEKALNQLN